MFDLVLNTPQHWVIDDVEPAEGYLEPYQASKMEPFAKIVNGFYEKLHLRC